MDRWEDGDGLDRGPKAPMTGVSKMGMSAFIKSSEGDDASEMHIRCSNIRNLEWRRRKSVKHGDMKQDGEHVLTASCLQTDL
jgi:hypothetical protein